MPIQGIFKLLTSFDLPFEINDIEPLKIGHINDTFILNSEKNNQKFILQKINTEVFKDIPALMKNIDQVLSLIHDQEKNPVYPKLINTKEGESFYQNEDNYWRIYTYAPNSISYSICPSPEHAYNAAKTAGYFQSILLKLNPSDFTQTIPNFHNLNNRFLEFEDTIKLDSNNRAKEVQTEIDYIISKKELSACTEGLPERLVHNDLKFNNILFNQKTKEALAVVDYDTIMPGLILYDFGDLVRSAATTAAEDEKDLKKVSINMENYQALQEGYLFHLKDNLSKKELDSLTLAPQYMTLMLGIRFLSDYLNGDRYFKTDYVEHNLIRAKNQFHLLKQIDNLEQAVTCK